MKNFLYAFLQKWNWFDAIRKGHGMQRVGRVWMGRVSGRMMGSISRGWKF